MARNKAWQRWLEIHGSRLMLYARQLTRCEADAEDVVQNALVKSWRALAEKTHNPRRSDSNATDPESNRGLIFANIRRCAIDLGRSHQRRDRRDRRLQQQLREEGEHVAWFELPDDDDVRQIQVAVTAIPLKFREVITLKIWGGLTFAEIATALDLSPNTVASRYRYGLETLRIRLDAPASRQPPVDGDA